MLGDLFEDHDSTEEYLKYGQLIRTKRPNRFSGILYLLLAFVLQHEIQPTRQKNYIEFFAEINRYTELLP